MARAERGAMTFDEEKAVAALRRAEAQLERFAPGRERNEASSRIHSGLAFIARGYTRESGSGGRIGRGVVNSHLRWLARALRARK